MTFDQIMRLSFFLCLIAAMSGFRKLSVAILVLAMAAAIIAAISWFVAGGDGATLKV